MLESEAQVVGLAPIGLATGPLEAAQEAADTLRDIAVGSVIFGGRIRIHDGRPIRLRG
jgi:hypothetical protein